MVNTQLLEARIHESGLRQNFIVDKIGISNQAFAKKKNNETPFRVSEIYVLCDLLNITNETDKKKIFFG